MSEPALKLGFNTPFAEQLAFFQQKLNLSTKHWDDILAAAHDRAFIVAGAMRADLLADLNAAVGKTIAEGKSLGWFRKEFAGIVGRNGWQGWTGEGSPEGFAWRTKVIYQTNLSTSYAAGRYQQLKDPELLTMRPYWRYVHSDNVANPRLQHVAWNGLTLPHDHPFWSTHFAPNGWGCHCRIVAVDAREYAKSQAAGLTEPPEGWDVRDDNGNLPGIAKGFDYAPGASVADEMRRIVAAKVEKLPEPLGSALLDDVAKQEKPAFAEAKTAKAAAEWAVKNNLADYADYAGVKPEVANAFNRSLFDHLQEFPELRKDMRFVGTCQAQFARWREIEMARYVDALRRANPQLPADFDFTPHAERYVKAKKVGGQYAHAWSNPDVQGVGVNRKFGADVESFESSVAFAASKGHFPASNNTIKSVADHEFGHMLDYHLGLKLDKEISLAYTEAVTKGIKDEVSKYAGTNISEFVAECWSESVNSPAPREFAQRIAEIIRARYRDKYS